MRIKLRQAQVASPLPTFSKRPAALRMLTDDVDDDTRLGREELLALTSIVWADGSASPAEVDAIQRIARSSRLSSEDLARVVEATKGPIPASTAPLSLHPRQAEHLYSLACLISAADGVVDPTERAAVAALARRLRLDEAQKARAAMAASAIALSLGADSSALMALAREMDSNAHLDDVPPTP
jgi:tellurite resistance protein